MLNRNNIAYLLSLGFDSGKESKELKLGTENWMNHNNLPLLQARP